MYSVASVSPVEAYEQGIRSRLRIYIRLLNTTDPSVSPAQNPAAAAKQVRAESLLLLTTLIWGTTFVVVKLSLSSVSPMLYVGLRFGLAAILYAAVFYKRLFPMPWRVVGASLGISLLLFLGFLFQTLGLAYTTAAKSSFFTGVYVILTPLFESVIERRPPSRRIWIAAGVVFGGLYLFSLPALSFGSAESVLTQLGSPTAFNIGDVLTLCCAAAYALYIVRLDRLTSQPAFSSDAGLPIQVGFVQVVFCAAGGLLTGFFLETPVFSATPVFYALLAYIAVFATVLTTYIQTRYQKDTTPSRAAIIFMMESVFSAALAFFILGETLGTAALIGGAMMLGGLFYAQRTPEPH